MFTINIYLRFALIVLGIGGGIVLAGAYGFWYGFPFILIGIILLLGYLLLGTIQSAAQLMQKMQFDEVEKRLSLTFFPKLLYKANRAYMFMIRGTIAMYTKDLSAAEIYLNKALETGLSTEGEKGTVYFQLANIAAQKNNWTAAQNQFKKAKEYKVSDPEMKEQYKQFEKALQNRGIMNPANRGMMMQPGGKRKRPRGM
ncbi:MAG TPA: hypothetical protein VK590_04405 [Saprospiraceae bacterium]|nr:hypothetical protein [Saprospiraceae bacterium]